jgi:hypothetical protein
VRQAKLAAEARHGRRKLGRGRAFGDVLAARHQLVGIEIAERAQPRQQQRPARATTQESLVQRAAAAPRRQQHGLPREG